MEQSTGKRRPGRPRRPEPGKTHSLFCTDAGWEWLLGQSIGRGHKSVGKWVDAFGRAPLKMISEAGRRMHGVPTSFERAKDGTNYGRSIQAVRERFGLSTTELAKELGVAKRTVEGWEGGRMPSGPIIVLLQRLATRLKPLDTDELPPQTPMAAAVTLSTHAPAPTPPPAPLPHNPLDELEDLCSQPELAELEYEAQQRGEAGPITLCQPTE